MINVQAHDAAPWLAVMQALAGAEPYARSFAEDSDESYRVQEQIKSHATKWRLHYAEPMHAAFRAPYWVLHAYAHWWRSQLTLSTTWDASEYDYVFPNGMDFRRYLGAWLYSVGMARLNMTAADVEAVHNMTGVAVLPHELLPCGHSLFLHEPIASLSQPQQDEDK